MYTTALVLAAGRGRRLKSETPKPLVKINGKPLIAYSLELFSHHSKIKDIVVVTGRDNAAGIRRVIKQYRIPKARRMVLGGRERQDSVRCGLGAMDKRTTMVLIHDAARPFIDRRTVSSVIAAAQKFGAAIAGMPVRPTIKRVTGLGVRGSGSLFIKQTIDRKHLWEAQTPQVFKKDIIVKAFARYGSLCVTDDASLAEKLKIRVAIVKGSAFNIKITTFEDLVIAEAIAKNLKVRVTKSLGHQDTR